MRAHYVCYEIVLQKHARAFVLLAFVVQKHCNPLYATFLNLNSEHAQMVCHPTILSYIVDLAMITLHSSL